jgi:ribA/ribD-fused uncharacterized protein
MNKDGFTFYLSGNGVWLTVHDLSGIPGFKLFYMTFSKQALIDEYPNSTDIPFLFFWGHKPSADGHITKSCFSQWWVAPFEVDGTIYPTAEHWMMAGKAKLFGDQEALKAILSCDTPAKAKKQGRLVQGFEQNTWDQHKYDIVVDGNFHKFTQHAVLKDFLLSTGDQVLVEASPFDTIWGIGLNSGSAAARNPAVWRGENLLGFALMEVRDKIR